MDDFVAPILGEPRDTWLERRSEESLLRELVDAAPLSGVAAVAQRAAVRAVLAALAELVGTAAPRPVRRLAAGRPVGTEAGVLALHEV